MNKEDILKILEMAKDKNGEVPMRLVRQAFEKLPESCEDAVSRKKVFEYFVSLWECIGTIMDRNEWEDVCKTIANELPSAQPEQRWIPCSERLPEDGKKHYWVCTDTGYQCECRWTNINHFWTDLTTDWHWHIMDIPQYSAVIAWMPLPEPWQEGEEG